MMLLSNRFKPDEVHQVYRKAYKVKVPWNEIVDEDVMAFIDLWCQAKNWFSVHCSH